jgi:aspartate racemase
MIQNSKLIGIIGGVGPYAGLDLTEKIFDETIAQSDQDHLPVILLSIPEKIADRTEFLLGKTEENPAVAVAELIHYLEQLGARVIGIPCNTMHATKIFGTIQSLLHQKNSKVHLLNMIKEVIRFIKSNHPEIGRVGIMSTKGTYKSEVYKNALYENGLEPVLPDVALQNSIHDAIYNPEYGIKAVSRPVSNYAREMLNKGIQHLEKKRAQGIVLGCTEIAFALTEKESEGLKLFDATRILARALIRETYPEKLRKF